MALITVIQGGDPLPPSGGSDVPMELVYMVAALLFVVGIKQLGRVRSARRGNQVAAVGMLLAVAATLFHLWGSGGLVIVILGVIVGSVAGTLLAKRVPMTAMPELVALFNGLGGAASMLVAWAEFAKFTRHSPGGEDAVTLAEGFPTLAGSFGGLEFTIAGLLSVLIGAVTLSGSLVAYAKLAGKLKQNKIWQLGHRPLNGLILGIVVLLCAWVGFGAGAGWAVHLGTLLILVGALALGVGLVVPIGGADMPVVISLLNSYSGLAACATGFVLQNNLLIVAGSLVGASGLILSQIMCKAMNRSLGNVLFAGIDASAGGGDQEYKGVKSTSASELAMLLDSAQSVIFVPGYGLAVAQAQHKVRELATLLEQRGCQVRYAIHPVAGRMPGHMNVLLAEANVPYEQLFELDQINGDFKQADLAIVLGANDVCNPVAYEEKSPIAGMPVLDVWDARTVVVVKRSLSPGYAGIKNPLFERENSLLLFQDAKAALEETIAELKLL